MRFATSLFILVIALLMGAHFPHLVCSSSSVEADVRARMEQNMRAEEMEKAQSRQHHEIAEQQQQQQQQAISRDDIDYLNRIQEIKDDESSDEVYVSHVQGRLI